MRDLAQLPKGHLHVHLEGAMRATTLVELATASGIPVPAVRGHRSFLDLASSYDAVCSVIRSEADLRRLVDEVVADAALAGAVWVEPATHLPRHRDRLGPDEAVLEVILDELAHAASRHGIGTGLVLAADRTLDPSDAVAQARLAVRYAADGVVSFGLQNEETGRPPEPFVAAFDIALAGGLLSVPHAGELMGPASVAGAIDVLGAHRVQHGTRSVEDPDLVVRLADREVCLDVSPTANVQLGVVATYADHPLPDLLAAGVRCSINADDPLLVGTDLLEEYERCRADLGLTDCQLATVARSSIEASGAPDALKVHAAHAIDAWMATAVDAVA